VTNHTNPAGFNTDRRFRDGAGIGHISDPGKSTTEDPKADIEQTGRLFTSSIWRRSPLAEKMIRIETRIEAIRQGIVEIEALIRTRQAGVPPF